MSFSSIPIDSSTVAALEDDRGFKLDQEVRVRRGGGYILTGKPHMLRLRGSRVAGRSTETPLRLFMAFLRTVGQGAIDMKSSVTWLVLVLLLLNLLVACAPGPNQSKGTENEHGSVSAF